MHAANQAVEWLNQYHSKEPRLGLERVQALLALVDHPELKSKVIHIAGTNGKGSTIAHLTQLIQGQGLRVGIFSSPYMTAYEEQITINQEPIPAPVLAKYIEKYQAIFQEHGLDSGIKGITEFELVTVIAYDYFAQEAVDWVIMETGLGGLLDSTNVCQPQLTGITTIGLDHQAILGNTLAEIAQQKAGIIKTGAPVVTGKIAEEALRVIEAQAENVAVPIYHYGQEYATQAVNVANPAGVGEYFIYKSPLKDSPLDQQELMTPLLGQHQIENAGMAIALFEILADKYHWPYSQESIQASLKQSFIAGRMEIIQQKPLIVLDGAHNPHAVQRLVDNLQRRFSDRKIDLLFACINTKDIQTMLNQLHQVPLASFNLTQFDHDNAFTTTELQSYLGPEDHFVADWQTYIDHYLQQAKEEPDENSLLLITGSLYFLSEIRPYLIEKLQQPSTY